MVRGRISDPRVIQYWDKHHLVAQELSRQLSSEPTCCRRKGILWDLAALYAAQAQWGSSPPIFDDGPVVNAVPALESRLGALSPGSAKD